MLGCDANMSKKLNKVKHSRVQHKQHRQQPVAHTEKGRFKMRPEYIRGLKKYMQDNQEVNDWNNLTIYQRRQRKIIFNEPAYIIEQFKHVGSTIRYQVHIVPIWVKQTVFRKHRIHQLPHYEDMFDKRADILFNKWAKLTKSPIHAREYMPATVVLEKVFLNASNQTTSVQSFSTYDDLMDSLIKEKRIHKFTTHAASTWDN